MSLEELMSRREFIRLSAALSAGLLITGCSSPRHGSNGNGASVGGSTTPTPAGAGESDKDEDEGIGVTATEDLMREHGVLRRALLVYTAAAKRLRENPSDISPDALQKTAKLFRAFGEDYHEQKLEEAFIFPAVKQAGGPAAALPDVLMLQHQRGREITDYILAVTQGAKFGAGTAGPLSQALDSLVWMYENHAAREDTVLFPAWKATMDDDEFDEVSDQFEEIEKQQFGEDGFETALKQIADIESALGLADLSQFTPPPPPKA
jgi:hemerythrin-like domain-containing protein